MMANGYDEHGRKRCVTVSFRVSEEERNEIDALVAMSGLTKQDYIMARLRNREITVQPNVRVQKALRNRMADVYLELCLRRIRNRSEIGPELAEVIGVLASEFIDLGGNRAQSAVEAEDDAIMGMERK